ncbi:MAG: hypothetical protein IJZ81_02825, partial [Clostridia bacterium]|nr:hypothetical protein [Clostridia bacterium]
MSQKNKHIFDENSAGARFAITEDNPYGEGYEEFDGFSSRREMIFASLHNYWGNCKAMMASSLSHFRNPSTIIVLIILITVYVLLTTGRVGEVQFSFYNSKVVQYIKTNFDITINAFLGFFYGPVTCCIGVTLCTIVRMAAEKQGIFAGYIVAAIVAGFMHGWILYRHKALWFGTRFRGFHTDLLSKVIITRLYVTVLVNILFMSVIYKIFIDYPIYEYIMHYSKSGVELTSFWEFLSGFVVGIVFE